MKKISIKDIAQQVGVSTTTVSFVLNGKAREKRISEELKNKILKVASKLNYRPNQVARGLRTGQTHTIGLIVEDIANPFFSGLARVVEDEADKHGYKVMYCSTENNEEKAAGILQMLHHRQMDGFIIIPTPGLKSSIADLQQEGRPLVLVDRYYPDVPSNYVVLNNYQGAFDAVTHLFAEGNQLVGFVTLADQQIQMKERLRGYHDAIAQQGKQQSPAVLSLPYHSSMEEGGRAVEQFIQQHPGMDAMLFATNFLAVFGLSAFRKLDLVVGEDMAMISFDDCDLFRFHHPGISAVDQPLQDIGQQAVNILISRLNGGDPELKQQVIEPVLRIRESSQAQTRKSIF